jgi:hypothetical protein
MLVRTGRRRRQGSGAGPGWNKGRKKVGSLDPKETGRGFFLLFSFSSSLRLADSFWGKGEGA